MVLERVHILIGSGVWQQNNLLEDCGLGETYWTINARAKVGDTALFYLSLPVSGIVARGIVGSPARKNTDEESGWAGYYMAHVRELRMLSAPLSRAAIRAGIPQWGYFFTPVRSCVVPEAHLQPLLNLIRDVEANEEAGCGS